MKPARDRAVSLPRPGLGTAVPPVVIGIILAAAAFLVFREWWQKFPFVPQLFPAYFARDGKYLIPAWPGIIKTLWSACAAVFMLACFEFASWRAGRFALAWAAGEARRSPLFGLMSLGIGNGIAGTLVLAAGLNGLLTPVFCWPVFVAILGASFYDAFRDPGFDMPPLRLRGKGNSAEAGGEEDLGLVGKVLLGFCAFIVAGNFLPTLEPEWFYDSLVYHLAVPQQYLLNHKICYLSHTFFSNFPFLQEMQYTVFIVLGNDISARLLHWFNGVLASAAVYFLARIFMGRTESVLAAAVFLSQSSLRFLMHVTMVELGLTWFSLLATAAFLKAFGWTDNAEAGRDSGVRLKWLFICAWFLGFGQGTKYLGIITSFLLISWLVIESLKSRSGTRRAAAASGLIVAWAAVWTFPWLFKNWFFTRNPFFPFLPGVFDTLNWGPDLYAKWMSDNTKYGTGHGGLINILKMPLLASVEDSNFGTFTLNPFYLLFMPLLLFVRSMPKGVFFLAVYCASYFLLWSISSQQTRFLMPMAANASVVTAFLISGLWRTGLLAGLPAAGVASWIFIMAAYGEVENRHSNNALVPFSTGYLDRESLLRIGVNYYEVLEKANESVPDERRLFFLGGDESYYCRTKYICNSIYDVPEMGRLARRARSAEELREFLRRQRVSHVLIHEPRAEEYAAYGIFDWGEGAQETYLDFAAKYLKLVFVSKGVFLHEITEKPVPLRERKTGRPLYMYRGEVVRRVKDLLAQADYLFKKGRLTEAKAAANEVMRMAGDVSVAYSYRGYANSMLGLDGEGIEDYEKAVQLGYPTPSVYYNLGLLLEKKKRFQRALEVQMEVTRMEPTFIGAKEKAASLALLLDKRDLALELATELLASGSRDPEFLRRAAAIRRAALGIK